MQWCMQRKSGTTSTTRPRAGPGGSDPELPMRTDPARGSASRALDRCLERLRPTTSTYSQIHNAKMEHVRDGAVSETPMSYSARVRFACGARHSDRPFRLAPGEGGWFRECEPDVGAIQMIRETSEQHPGSAMPEAARRHASRCAFTIRVPHASGMPEATTPRTLSSPSTTIGGICSFVARERGAKDPDAGLPHDPT